MTDRPIPMSPQPDAELGHALERFDPPALDAGFWQTLTDRLAAEPDVAAPSERRRRPWRRLAAIAAAAAIVAVLVLWFGLPGVDEVKVPGSDQGPVVVGPEPATAAEVVAELERALMTVHNVQGTLIERSLVIEPDAAKGGNLDGVDVPPGTYHEWLYETVIRADGSFRRELTVERWTVGEDGHGGGDFPRGSFGTGTEAYDSGQGVWRLYSPEYSFEGEWGAEQAMETRGVAAGPPDWYIGVEFGHGAVARAARHLATGTVEGVVYDGRPAWVVSTPIPSEEGRGNTGLNATCDRPIDRIAVTVDEETGYPVRIREYAHGVVHYEVRLEGVKIDEPIPADTFTLDRSEGWPESEDLGYRKCTLGELGEKIGRDPRLPFWLPDGYEVGRVTYAADTGNQNEPSLHGEDAAVVRYERGFGSITVTVRRAAKPRYSAVNDPFAGVGNYWPDDAPPPDLRPIEKGSYAGSTARVVTSQVVVPHLWLVDGDTMVTVAGDLTERELLRIVESM